MAIATLTPRTRVTTLAETALNVRTTLQPHTYYTCPAGKKAIVKGRVTCTGTGAATEGRFLINAIIIFRWEVDALNTTSVVPDETSFVKNSGAVRTETPLEVFRSFDITLAAGETISTNQDSGTNAEFDLFASVLELPA